MMRPKVVVDTNVFVAALRSRRGASFRLVSLLGRGWFEIVVSTPLVLEYEEVLLRHRGTLSEADIGDFLDSLCAIAVHQEVFYLWRPQLRDPRDDMVLEVAVAAGCDAIVTYNQRDFVTADRFGIGTPTPWEFLKQIGEAE